MAGTALLRDFSVLLTRALHRVTASCHGSPFEGAQRSSREITWKVPMLRSSGFRPLNGDGCGRHPRHQTLGLGSGSVQAPTSQIVLQFAEISQLISFSPQDRAYLGSWQSSAEPLAHCNGSGAKLHGRNQHTGEVWSSHVSTFMPLPVCKATTPTASEGHFVQHTRRSTLT